MTDLSRRTALQAKTENVDAFDASTIINTCLDLGMTHKQATAFADRSMANRRKAIR